MAHRVLVPPRLPVLQSGNKVIDAWVQEHLQPWISRSFDQLTFLNPEDDTFTPIIGGSGTAGTYEILTNYSRYHRMGDLVFVSIWVTLAAAITAGGTGDLNISGLPWVKVDSHAPYGVVVLSGVNWAAGANLAAGFGTTGESSTLFFLETNDNAAVTVVPISGVAANDLIIASIFYITNGVRA